MKLLYWNIEGLQKSSVDSVKFVRNWIILLKIDMLQPNQIWRKGANTMKNDKREAD